MAAWRRTPPVHILAAAYLEFKPEPGQGGGMDEAALAAYMAAHGLQPKAG